MKITTAWIEGVGVQQVGERCMLGNNEFVVTSIENDMLTLAPVAEADLSDTAQAHKVSQRLGTPERTLEEIAEQGEFY